uniref:Uncharacterized protein n=1 Tax=Panagrolaimus sp. ES5 TaxID=591445 RepID=A0AC34FP95_9BILA
MFCISTPPKYCHQISSNSSTNLTLCIPTDFCYYFTQTQNNRIVEEFGCDTQLKSLDFLSTMKFSLIEMDAGMLHSQNLSEEERNYCLKGSEYQQCGCLANFDAESPCNDRWIKKWKILEFSNEDWFWFGSGGILTIAFLCFLIIFACHGKKGPRNPKVIKSSDHVYLPKPVTLKWALMALFIVFLQILQFISAIIVGILLWLPFFLDCPTWINQNGTTQRYVPEYAFIIQLINSTTFSSNLLKVCSSGIFLFAQFSFLRIIIFRRSILRFRGRHCFTAFIGFQCVLIILTGIVGFGDLSELENLNYGKCSLNLSRILWIRISAIVFFSTGFIEFIVLLILRWNFRRVFHKKSLLEDSTQHSITEYTYSSCQTGLSNHSDIDYDLLVSPVPFILNSDTGSTLELFNGCDDEWLAVRILTRTPNTYNIYPQKHLIPPRRRLSSRITLHGSISFKKSAKTLDNAILIEYYQIGEDTPFFSSNRPWMKPYLCVRNKWKYKIVLGNICAINYNKITSNLNCAIYNKKI